MGKDNPTLSVIIPVYNEEEVIHKTIEEIVSVLKTTDLSYEIILVDDGSSDETWTIIKIILEDLKTIRAIRLSRNFGKEAAIMAGLRTVDSDATIVMDGDLQHPPELLPKMIAIWQNASIDVVETIKVRQQNEKATRQIGTKLFYKLIDLLTDYDLSRMSDYKLLDRKVVQALLELEEYNRFFRGLVAWVGFTRVEIEFTVPDRVLGTSSWSMLSLISFALRSVVSFSAKPLQIITIMGVCFSILSVVIGLRVAYQFLVGTALDGFATVILLQLIIGTILMFGMGILGLYIASVYDEVKKRQMYFISEEITNTE